MKCFYCDKFVEIEMGDVMLVLLCYGYEWNFFGVKLVKCDEIVLDNDQFIIYVDVQIFFDNIVLILCVVGEVYEVSICVWVQVQDLKGGFLDVMVQCVLIEILSVDIEVIKGKYWVYMMLMWV